MSSEELKRGVICSSAGNHAQGVALSAQRLGCRATICMPLITPDIKVEAVRRLGGNVKLIGENYDECQAYAIKVSPPPPTTTTISIAIAIVLVRTVEVTLT